MMVTSYGPDILSKYEDAIKIKTIIGYIVPSDSDVGISWDIKGEIYYPLRSYPQKMSYSKPRTNYYIQYDITTYKSKSKWERDGLPLFERTQYYLPTGELIYIGDCSERDSQCRRNLTREAIRLYDTHFVGKRKGMNLRKKFPKIKPKTKRCRCKK